MKRPSDKPFAESGADIGILGGGISGLSLAAFLRRPAEVLEADDRVGGLARSFGQDGFSSDIGGHILFSKDKEVLDCMVEILGTNVDRRRRNNVILYDGAFVKYPFENGLGDLPSKQDAFECARDFIKAWYDAEVAPQPAPENLAQWCYQTFGRAISEKYLLPYNEKIWKRAPEEIGTEWVDRIPRPPMEDVLASAIGLPTEGYTHQLHFFYPRQGAIESLPKAFAERARKKGQRITTNFRVDRVRREGRFFLVASGQQVRRYETLVCTIPILPFLRTLEEVPDEIMADAQALAYNSLRVVLLGLKQPGLDTHTAVYVPNPRSIYHRVCFNNAFSPSMAPPDCSSVSVEITCSDGDETSSLSDEALASRVVEDLRRDGLVDPARIVTRKVHRERYAYVVYDHGYSDRVSRIRSFLLDRDIHLAGRFAEYRYVNMDACIRRTLDLAQLLDDETAVANGDARAHAP